MNYFPVPKIIGIVKDYHGRIIQEDKAQDGLNIMFEGGHIFPRWGYRMISANLPLSGTITHIVEFEKLITHVKHLVVCTTRDIYYWDMNRGLFVPITPDFDFSANAVTIEEVDDILTVAIDDTVLNTTTMTETDTYIVVFTERGVSGADNVVHAILTTDDFSLQQSYVWLPFYLSGNLYETYTGLGINYCIVCEERDLPDSTELAYRSYSGGVVENVFKSIRFFGCALDNIDNDTEYYGLLGFVRGSPTRLFYHVFEEVEGVTITCDIDSDDNITNISGGDVWNGALITLASVTYMSETMEQFDMCGILSEVDNTSGTAVRIPLNEYYENREDADIFDTLYEKCIAFLGTASGVSLHIKHRKIDLNELPGQYASIRCDSYSADVTTLAINMRKTTTGGMREEISDIDDFHDSAIVYDISEEDNALLLTNGVDEIKRWSGSGLLQKLGETSFTGTITSGSAVLTGCSGFDRVRPYQVLKDTNDFITGNYVIEIDVDAGTITMNDTASGSQADDTITAASVPNKAKFIEWFGSIGYEHVIIGNTIDTGVNNKQTLEFSAASEIDVWGIAGESFYVDLINTNDPVVGIRRLGTRLYVYKENSITELWPIEGGGNSNAFDYNENKIEKGTPSIRTVVTFTNFHIFFGWDNVYINNGITATPIGDAIINDLNSGINRPYINRCFAVPLYNKNLYCLFVPYGSDAEYCNRVYVYNYIENHWTIWQLTNEMTCSGAFHQAKAPTWDDILAGSDYVSTIEGTTVNESEEVSMTSVTGIEVGNVVEGEGIPDNTNVIEINGTTIVMSNEATASDTVDLTFSPSWDNMLMKWEDLILYEDNERIIFGDADGYIYEFTSRHFLDELTAFSAYVVTRDYPLNDIRHYFRLCQTIIGVCNKLDGSFQISASVDFGNTWIDVDAFGYEAVDIDYGDNYIEYIANWLETGRQVRFKIENIDGSYFSIESLNIGFEDAGIQNVQGV